MKPKHQRLLFIAFSVLFLCIATLLVLQAFRQNVVFFYSPTEIAQAAPAPDRVVRIGGLVETGSVRKQGDKVDFRVTDGKNAIDVTYRGMLPTLFNEGQGVVAEGSLTAPDMFQASRILAKHDENYMPPEVVDALKKSGRWKEGEQ